MLQEEEEEGEEQLVKHRGGNSAGHDGVCVDLSFIRDLKWILLDVLLLKACR